MRSLIVLALTLAVCVAASPISTPQWTVGKLADESAPVSFTMALKQRNLDQLENIASSVSNPNSDNYQNFLSTSQILSIIAPPAETVETILSFLESQGVKRSMMINLGDAIDVRTSVSTASALFNTKFYEYTTTVAPKTPSTLVKKHKVIKAESFTIPEKIAQYVDMVVGISNFPVPHLDIHKKNFIKNKKANENGSAVNDSDAMSVPDTFYYMYQVPTEKYGNATLTSMGVIEIGLDQGYSPKDLLSYANLTNIKIVVPTNDTTVGPNASAQTGEEAQLDVEAIGALDVESPMWFWIEGGDGWLYTMTTHFFSTKTVPDVVSLSYAWSELDQCQMGIGGTECQSLNTTAAQYVARVEVEFQKIASRGVSFLSASGDSGANGRTNGMCDYSGGVGLKPDYPAASAWVTSVGATELHGAVALKDQPALCTGETQAYTCVASGTEVAVSNSVAGFASGGGFSWDNKMPAWQKTHVESYLSSSKDLPTVGFNKKGRGFPDISAIGNNFLIEYIGSASPVAGTSVSSPIVAGLVSLLNQVSLKMTKKTLGFISPLLYKMYEENKSIFHDVTVGDNICTEDGCAPSCQGFTCAKGWDPVTGLGTLNYSAAEAYLLKFLEKKMEQRTLNAFKPFPWHL